MTDGDLVPRFYWIGGYYTACHPAQTIYYRAAAGRWDQRLTRRVAFPPGTIDPAREFPNAIIPVVVLLGARYIETLLAVDGLQLLFALVGLTVFPGSALETARDQLSVSIEFSVNQ